MVAPGPPGGESVAVPVRQNLRMGAYLARQRLAGREKFPLMAPPAAPPKPARSLTTPNTSPTTSSMADNGIMRPNGTRRPQDR